MPKHFDTDRTPWLFMPHDDGELDEYFTADHSEAIADTSRSIIKSPLQSVCANLETENCRRKIYC